MGKSTITLQVQNFDSLMRQVQQLKDGGKKAIKNTVNDMKARAPGWISDEVRKQYNIKKSEIMPAKKGEGGKAANIRVSGETIETMTLIYTGNPLTPLHFSMTPKRPAALTDKKRAIPGEGVNAKGGAALNVAMARVRKKYSITLQPKKEKGTATRKVRTPPLLLRQPVSATTIPFQRSPWKYPVTAIHTLSAPQMIDNETVNANIYKKLNDDGQAPPAQPRPSSGSSPQRPAGRPPRRPARARPHTARRTERHSAAQTPHGHAAPQGTVTGLSPRCWRAQNAQPGKIFSGRSFRPSGRRRNAMPNPTNNKLVDSKTIAPVRHDARRVQQLTKEGVITAVKKATPTVCCRRSRGTSDT
ncbi:MAG: hypothetical protein ACLUEK_10975 [Oscillospiraceae bacterium]